MKKTYNFDYDYGKGSAKIELDTDVFTSELAMATLTFFLWDYDSDNDPIDEVVRKYALEAIREATINNHNTNGVIEDFKGKEGFAPLDGSMGISLLSVEGIEIEDVYLTLE